MRSFILILILILTFIYQSALAAANYLNAVVLEGTDSGYNVVLRSDATTKVKKTITSNDRIVLTIKGITISKHINILYKNTTNAGNIIVEKAGNDELKVYINARNVANANIIFNTPNSAPIAVGDKFAREKLLWSCFSVLLLLLMVHYIKSQNKRIVKKITMREREIEFYKANIPGINYKMAQQAYASSPLHELPKTLRQFHEVGR